MRFPEFGGEWNKQVLMELMEFKVTNSFSRENLNYENGTVKNIHYGDIHTKFQTLFDITKEVVPYINEDISIDRISGDFYCKEGDIVFADASEDLNDVGKSIEIANLDNEKLLSGLHTLLARPKADYFHKGFNGYLFKSNSVRFQIQKEAQGTKVLSISAKRISNIKLSFPSILEQEKITGLLTLTDERISTQNKIIDNLETLIKGFREKLFKQEIRLKSKMGNSFPKWNQKTLGEISKKKSSNISANKIENNFGEYILYGASEILKNVDFYEEENNYISIVKDGAGVGRLLYCESKSSVLGTMDIIKPQPNINTYFLFYLLSTINFTKYVTGSTIPHIYFKDYKNETCFIPCIEEQNKIASFLSLLDEKLQVEKTILKHLTEQKQFLLQQLFI